MTRRLSCGSAALTLALCLPAAAQADVVISGASADGHLHLEASASPRAPTLHIREVIDGRDVAVSSAPAADSPYAADTSTASASLEWTCAQGRVFVAVTADERSTPVIVPTPSCADRLRVDTPRRIFRGESLRITLKDTWGLGGIVPSICVAQPDGAVGCVDAAIGRGEIRTSRVTQALLSGRWAARVTYGAAGVDRAIDVVAPLRGSRKVPRILVTGDSMIEVPGRTLQRTLSDRARVIADIYYGSGITRPSVVDWATLPAVQVAAYRPDATIVSLGMVDYGALDVGGSTVACCGTRWTAAYAAAVRRIMTSYSQDGRAAVVWLNEPFPLNPASRPRIRSVNDAIRDAAAGLRRTRVLDVAALLTPGETFRRSMRLGGRWIRVRNPDGLHMSAAGSRLVTRTMIDPALVGLGVLEGAGVRGTARGAPVVSAG